MKRLNSKIKTPNVLFKSAKPKLSETEINTPIVMNNNNISGISAQQYFNPFPNLDFNSEEIGENIKVSLRIRPLNPLEMSRGDQKCVNTKNNKNVDFQNKNINKNYSFDNIFNESMTQEELFYSCSMNKIIDSALDGYSVTVFAYGQTGSGKTYTMLGRDDAINEQILNNDKLTGIIPKSVKYIWNSVTQRNEKFYVKVSFLEIYNEQINDLLSPKSTNLQIRWDQKQGFFVENLTIFDCRKPEEVVEAILEASKNRKIGSHELNKDSSRSHCIMTVYIISESGIGSDKFKKYGKISFVDLAGSERLKESKSQGDMIKETGNINKSLFTLGKVISCLTDKKLNKQHIPYRDSKLTMLLMDSIGGTSKTLMIACVSPSSLYADETMSTLNYASRAMNIKNKPILQIDSKEGLILLLKNENQMLKMENEMLKSELLRLGGGYPTPEGFNMQSKKVDTGKLEKDINELRSENAQLKKSKEQLDRQYNNIKNENDLLNAKLNNLESIFIGSNIIRHRDGSVTNDMGEDYNLSALVLENNELKKRVDTLELEKSELKEIIKKGDNPGKKVLKEDEEINKLADSNAKLMRRVEFLQKRERELLETIMKLKNN